MHSGKQGARHLCANASLGLGSESSSGRTAEHDAHALTRSFADEERARERRSTPECGRRNWKSRATDHSYALLTIGLLSAVSFSVFGFGLGMLLLWLGNKYF